MAQPKTAEVGPLAKTMITAVFLLMLLGSFSLARLGLSGLPVREPVVATALVALVFVPVWIASRGSIKAVGGQPVRALLGVLLLLAVLAASAAWGPWGVGTGGLLVSLALMAVQLALGSLAISLDPEAAADRLVRLFAATGLAYAVLGLLAGDGDTRLAVLGGGPNVYGRVVALAIVAIVGLVLIGRLPVWAAWTVPPLSLALVLSGSRGSMLACAVGAMVLFSFARHRARRLGTVALVVAIVSWVLHRWTGLAQDAMNVVSERIVRLTLIEGYSAGRDGLASEAIQIIAAHPVFGGGLGAFTSAVGFDTYPHNLVLSVLVASGVVGGVVLGALLLSGIGAFRDSRKDPLRRLVLALSTVVFTSAMFSGGLFDSRFFWLLLITALTLKSQAVAPVLGAGGRMRSPKPVAPSSPGGSGPQYDAVHASAAASPPSCEN